MHRRLLLATLVMLTPLHAAEKVALVIGNERYPGEGRLANPVRDARAMAAMLEKAGFQVITAEDTRAEAFYSALERLKQAASGATVGLVFYAGHGVEVDGRNYLLPVDATLENPAQLRTQAVALDAVLADLDTAGCEARVVILDCCRVNPLATRGWLRTRGSGGGLAALDDSALPPSTLVLFAASPGQVALDGAGGNSPFTAALLKHLQQPGLSLLDAFFQTSDEVMNVTRQKQDPWVKFDGGGRVFRTLSITSGKGAVPVLTPAPPSATMPPPAMAAVQAAKPVVWSKGLLKAELVSFSMQSPTNGIAVVKLTNTSADKTLKLAFDWQGSQDYSRNPPPGSVLSTAGGALLDCTRSSGLLPITFLEATRGRGVLGTAEDVIAEAPDLGPAEEVTLTLNYGLVEEERGFGISTDRSRKPAVSQPPANARHRITLGLWQAVAGPGSHGQPTRVSVQLNDIPSGVD